MTLPSIEVFLSLLVDGTVQADGDVLTTVLVIIIMIALDLVGVALPVQSRGQ